MTCNACPTGTRYTFVFWFSPRCSRDFTYVTHAHLPARSFVLTLRPTPPRRAVRCMPYLGRLEKVVARRHSRVVGWQPRDGSEICSKQVQSRMRTLRRWALLVGLASFICVAMPKVVNAQVSEWQADPGCPAPTNLPLASLGRRADAPADDLSVRVTVTAVEGGWRAVLAASEHDGSPLGERVLEHPTCEGLNRAVLVSLSVLLGTQSPVAPDATEGAPNVDAGSVNVAGTAGAAPAQDATTPEATTTGTTGIPVDVADAAPPVTDEPAVAPEAALLQPAEVTERRSPAERHAAAADEVHDAPPPELVSPRWSLPKPTFDVYGGVVLGLEATEARTVGGEAAVLASDRNWGVRVNGGLRFSAGNVANDPDVKFWVASGTLSACKYFGAATWLVCAGPLVERIHGTVPAASNPDAEAWLLGGSVGISTLRHTRDTWGWFAQLELQVRRGANFQVQTPSTAPDSQTLFSYPWAGLLLSLGPAVRL
jgi:hypothetical protein